MLTWSAVSPGCRATEKHSKQHSKAFWAGAQVHCCLKAFISHHPLQTQPLSGRWQAACSVLPVPCPFAAPWALTAVPGAERGRTTWKRCCRDGAPSAAPWAPTPFPPQEQLQSQTTKPLPCWLCLHAWLCPLAWLHIPHPASSPHPAPSVRLPSTGHTQQREWHQSSAWGRGHCGYLIPEQCWGAARFPHRH